MRKLNLLAFLFIGAVVFFVTGGGALFGVGGSSTQELPDTITPPNSTFVGSERDNPYAQ